MTSVVVYAAYTLALTFSGVGSEGSLQSHAYTMMKTCADMACVDEMYAHAYESPYLARMRVWAGSDAVMQKGGQAVWPPLRDEWYQ